MIFADGQAPWDLRAVVQCILPTYTILLKTGKPQAVDLCSDPGVKYEVFRQQLEGENSLSERTHTAASGTLKK